MYAAKPGAGAFSPWPWASKAVSKISRVEPGMASERIISASCRPSTSGIRRSIKAISYGVPPPPPDAAWPGLRTARRPLHHSVCPRGQVAPRSGSSLRCRRPLAPGAGQIVGARHARRGGLGTFEGPARNQKSDPLPRLALDADLAAHQLDEPLGDRQAEARAAERRVVEPSA